MNSKFKRLAIRFLFWLLIGESWHLFMDISEQVAADPGIPVYGADQVRFGREARRDEAVHRMSGAGLSDSQVNLGCELVYWWRKLGNI
jgi:hypothetical protein